MKKHNFRIFFPFIILSESKFCVEVEAAAGQTCDPTKKICLPGFICTNIIKSDFGGSGIIKQPNRGFLGFARPAIKAQVIIF